VLAYTHKLYICYVYTATHARTHERARARAHTHTHTHANANAHAHAYTHTHACRELRTNRQTHTGTSNPYICMFVVAFLENLEILEMPTS
jgi:hypothetical protein